MNKYFEYENRKYWDAGMWKNNISQVFPLVTWMGATEPFDNTPYDKPVDGLYGKDTMNLPFYDRKCNCVSIPEVVKYWNDRGVYYERRNQAGVNWLIMCPTKCLENFGEKIPAVIVFHNENIIDDPYWAMKTLEHFKSYNDAIAEDQNFMVFYICTSKPDFNRIYVNILQEAFVFVPGDVKETYLDISTVLNAGKKIADVPDFVYRDEKGSVVADPDSAIIKFSSANIPVLNVTGRWENRCSLTRDQVSMDNWSNAVYELDRVVHSETGKLFADGIALEHRFDTTYEPEFVEYWDKMGVKYEHHETKYRRWKSAVPKQAFEEPEKLLPVIAVLQEVNHANEHLAVTETSYFYEYYRICAQGECVLINFVLEDVEGNDLLVDILKEAKELYPMMDMSRVYVAGHSHNGVYSLAFAYRHPEMVAAVATYGNTASIGVGGMSGLTAEGIKEFGEKYDMPIINLSGMNEHSSMYPINDNGRNYRPWQGIGAGTTFEERAAGYQRRLIMSNCPMKTVEEIAATKNSPEGAIRATGIPGDRSEVMWLNGFECYIVDVKNNNGKWHLRFVAEENMPHNTTPNQQILSWSFMRRFKRDLTTGETIELY